MSDKQLTRKELDEYLEKHKTVPIKIYDALAEKVSLNEAAASDTLKDAQKAKRRPDAEVEAMEKFMSLDRDQKERHLADLQKALSHEDNDAWKPHSFETAYAELNRKGLKNTARRNKRSLEDVRQGVKEAFPGTSDETLDRMAEAFDEAVSKRSVADAMCHIFSENPILKLMFAPDEQLDEVEALAERIQELEQDLGRYGYENEQLRKARLQEQNEALYEDFIYQAEERRKKPYVRRHDLADDFEPDPENAWLLESDTPRRQPNDAVGRYAAYMENTFRNNITPGSLSASYLTETWLKQQ